MFANASNAPLDSSRRLRQRGPQQVPVTQNVEDELDSGYDGEDNLEPRRNDNPSAPSPESYFTSADNDEGPITVEPAEPVARKRARQACDYCRAKKCRARPNATGIANYFSAVESHSARNAERPTSFVIFLSITGLWTQVARKICPLLCFSKLMSG
jgi:hypothetical protein